MNAFGLFGNQNKMDCVTRSLAFRHAAWNAEFLLNECAPDVQAFPFPNVKSTFEIPIPGAPFCSSIAGDGGSEIFFSDALGMSKFC